MIGRKDQEKINSFMREHDIDSSSVLHKNCVRIHGPKESKKHFLMKCEICWDIYHEGRPYWTESFTRGHKRKFDVLDPLEMGVVEIETTKVKKLDANKTIRI